MQVTKENASMLKPGMLATVFGEKLEFVRHGEKPEQLEFIKPNAKKYERGVFIDLLWWKNSPVFTIG